MAGGALTIATDGDITETGALQAGRALMVESSGGAVHVQDRVESGADAVLQAGGDLVADGTRMAAAGDLSVVAGGSVFLRSQATGARETVLTYNGQPHGLETWREERRDVVRRADLNAGGLLVIDAGEDILLRATTLAAISLESPSRRPSRPRNGCAAGSGAPARPVLPKTGPSVKRSRQPAVAAH